LFPKYLWALLQLAGVFSGLDCCLLKSYTEVEFDQSDNFWREWLEGPGEKNEILRSSLPFPEACKEERKRSGTPLSIFEQLFFRIIVVWLPGHSAFAPAEWYVKNVFEAQ
jgi:hypothetical protein